VVSHKIQENQNRRRRILEAARNLFCDKGIANTTMEDIARAADYTRRTLYAYFRSRDEIYLLVYLEDLGNRWEHQKAAMATAGTGREKLRVWGESFYAYSRRNPQSLRLQVHWDYRGLAIDRIDADVFENFRRKNDEVADGLREIFRMGIEDGSLRPDLSVDLCLSNYILTLRCILNRALFPGYSFAKYDADQYVNNFIDLFLRGISKTQGD
jgi:AcrR family transcriptional regulator